MVKKRDGIAKRSMTSAGLNVIQPPVGERILSLVFRLRKEKARRSSHLRLVVADGFFGFWRLCVRNNVPKKTVREEVGVCSGCVTRTRLAHRSLCLVVQAE